jgi:hypothetical protein
VLEPQLELPFSFPDMLLTAPFTCHHHEVSSPLGSRDMTRTQGWTDAKPKLQAGFIYKGSIKPRLYWENLKRQSSNLSHLNVLSEQYISPSVMFEPFVGL